ncbi:transposase [Lysinibacillus fusiformis]|nr:transposase [Lysinibacillus fusiformis]MCG7436839.1 transposase [Lysinibacillus fusiformis]
MYKSQQKENTYLPIVLFSNPTGTRTLIPFLDEIEKPYFELPTYIVADAGYGSEQNYHDILSNRKREALIINMYLKEQKKKHKQSQFNADNWQYDKETEPFMRNVLDLHINLYEMIVQTSNVRSKSTNAKTRLFGMPIPFIMYKSERRQQSKNHGE